MKYRYDFSTTARENAVHVHLQRLNEHEPREQRCPALDIPVLCIRERANQERQGRYANAYCIHLAMDIDTCWEGDMFKVTR